MFTHQGHPVDREQHRRFKGKELVNELTPALRADFAAEGKPIDPRLNGCRVLEDGSQNKTPIASITGALHSEWVFWQKDHDEATA